MFSAKLEEGAFDFRMLATFALKDNLRPNVASAIKYATVDAGLKVRMVSNDHIETAKAVALKAGIIKPFELEVENAVMTGEDFASKVGNIADKHIYEGEGGTIQTLDNEETFKSIAKNLKVLARATAEHKKLLVVGLKACGISTEEFNDEKLKAQQKKTKLDDMTCKVSVTGEGINDVAALKEAQVGLAMGTACSSAKDSS